MSQFSAKLNQQCDVLEHRSCVEFICGRRSRAEFSDEYIYYDERPLKKLSRHSESFHQDDCVIRDRFEKFLPDDRKMQSSLTKKPEIICRSDCFSDDGFNKLPITRGLKVFDSRLQIDKKLKSLNDEGWEIKYLTKIQNYFIHCIWVFCKI